MRIASGLVALCMLTGSAFAKMDVADNVKVYKGSEAMLVKVVRTKPLGDNKALLQVSGSDTEMDGLTFLVGYEEDSNAAVHYTVKWHGRDWWVFSIEKRNGTSRAEYVQPGNLTKKQYLTYDDALSKAQKPADLAAGYEKDAKAKSAITDFNRKFEESRAMKEIAENTVDMKKACGVDLPTNVDWKSINDETIMTLSIAGFCGAPIDAMRRLCEQTNAAKKSAAKLKSVTCHYGAAMKLTVAGSSINWVFDKSSPNATDYAQKELESHL